MALDPNIILRAGQFDTPDYAKTMELREVITGRRAAAAEQMRLRDVAAATAARRSAVGARAAGGDIAGARQDAVAAGDFDLVEALNGLDKDQREAVARRTASAAPIAFEAAKLPYEGRRAFIAGQAATLKANGWTDEELAGFDPTDAALNGIVASSQSISDILKRADTRAEFEDKRADRAADRDFQRGNAYIAAGIDPTSAPGVGVAAPAAGGAGGGQAGTVAGIADIIIGREGTGKNPRSTSIGVGQFTNGTWLGMAKQNPDLVPSNMTDAQKLALRGNPAIARKMTERAVEGYLGQLQKAGLPASSGNAYLMHFLGPRALDVLRADPATPVATLLPPSFIEANPEWLNGRTAGQLINEMVTRTDGPSSQGAAATSGGLRPLPGGRLDPNKPKDAPSGYRWTADGSLEAIPGGPGDKQGRQANLKPPPVKAMEGYIGNRTSIGKIDEAQALVDAYPDATGVMAGWTPNVILSRTDPKGVDARAKIADIGSLLLHDRSGASVTASETPRLLPFIPQMSDDAATIRKKLANLRAAFEATNSDTEDVYSADQGYKFPTFRDRAKSRQNGTLKATPQTTAAPVRVTTAAQARALAPGTVFITPDGRRKVR